MAKHLETLLARMTDYAGLHEPFGASHFPIYQTATFDMKKQSGSVKFDYSRSNNPTRNVLEDIFTQAEGGAGCVCTNTGVAAIALMFETVLNAGDSIIVERDCYGGTHRLLKEMMAKWNIVVHYTDLTDLYAAEEILQSGNIKLVFCESPTNPGLKILDLQKIAELSKQYGAVIAVDNSLATFASQMPIALGADLSLFSATKYISGHGSVISGAIVSADAKLAKKIWYAANSGGRAQSPFEVFLVSLGLPTLPYRMKIHEQSALRIAEYLVTREDVLKVRFPFLPAHPQYELAKKQMKVCPGVLTIDMIDEAKSNAFVKKTKLFGEKASFGTADSRIEQPSTMSHSSYSEKELEAIGLKKSTLRISIGLENCDDLIYDIESALK